MPGHRHRIAPHGEFFGGLIRQVENFALKKVSSFPLAKGLAAYWPTETQDPLPTPFTEVTPGQFRISIAIPLHNEEAVIPELLSRLEKTLTSIEGGPHEIVLVDDGSTDSTAAVLEEAARSNSNLVVVVLSRNFGHQAALTAALDNVSGDAVVLMDADLQDRPEAIPLFLEKYRQGITMSFMRGG